MSGAGFDGAGQSGAGNEQAPTIPAARNVRPPHALYLDLSTMDFPMDENGRYIEIHPVDHAVFMAIGPEQGSIMAMPGQGLAWQSMPYESEAVMQRRANEMVRAKLAELLSRGDIADLTVTLRSNVVGRGRVLVRYKNTRIPEINDPYRTVETF